MATAVRTIHDELREAHERIKAIVATASRADRELTPDEDRELRELQARMETLDAKRKRHARFEEIISATNSKAASVALDLRAQLLPGQSVDLGAQVTKHPAFAEFLSRRGGGTPVSSSPFEIEAAAYVPTTPFPPTTASPPAASPSAPFGPYIARDLFVSLPASGGSVPYLQDQPPATGAADIVAAGAAKPEITLSPTLKNDPLVKIADWTGVANEALEDAAGFAAWVNSVLALSVIDREDKYLVDTLAALVGKVADRPAGSGENAAYAILAQAMLVQAASKLPVDGCIVASDTFAKLVTMKAVGGGGYLVGSPLGAPTSTLWGQLRLAVSVNQPSGTAVVGAFGRAAAIYRKAQLRIDLSESHADFFTSNLTAIRAEQRELLAVFKPLGFGTATGLLAITA